MNIAIPTLMLMMVVLVTLHSWSSYLCQELVSLALKMDLCNIISHQHPVIITIVDITHSNQNSREKKSIREFAAPALELDSATDSSLFGMGTAAPSQLEFQNRFLHKNFKLI